MQIFAKRTLLVWTVILAIAVTVVPVEAVERARLSPGDVGELNRIQTYLNEITTLESRFVQNNPDGTFSAGKLYIRRPGFLRFEYDPPVPHLLVADGSWFIHIDKELKQATRYPLSHTPAYFLLREVISFRDGLIVTGLKRGPSVLRVSLVESRVPDAGSITLTFSERPFELRKWAVFDAQGLETEVTLVNARFGGSLDEDLFDVVDPSTDEAEGE
jgi:outer membrane lipoprotein-sorting protein|tara:strand:- start:1037 stop:1684 length:648 start_codon:yes stop_codon:yes gene_type:complete